MARSARVRAPTSTRPERDERALAFEDLELALSAATRWLCSRDVTSEIGRHARCELTPSGLWLLEYLESAGPLRVSDVAECMRVDKSTMTQRLHALDAAGLIKRSCDPSDRRVSLIRISTPGRRLVARVRAARLQLLRDALGDNSPQQLKVTADVLKRIARAHATGPSDLIR